jgi:hypothetical protein
MLLFIGTIEDYPQIDHRHPDVRNDFMSWGPWVLHVCFPVKKKFRSLHDCLLRPSVPMVLD